jgi:hypothetical protein
MDVEDLRKIIEGLPDDMPIFIGLDDLGTYAIDADIEDGELIIYG